MYLSILVEAIVPKVEVASIYFSCFLLDWGVAAISSGTCNHIKNCWEVTNLLRLRITLKALQLPLYFFFSFSLAFLDRLAIVFYLCFSRLLLKTHMTSTKLFSFDTLKKTAVKNTPVVLICNACGHDVPCTLAYLR